MLKHAMFNRRDSIQKRLLKIKKQEAKTLQTLIKQEDELRKAVDENNELIKVLLDVESSEEMTLRKEIDELTKKRSTLQNKLEELRDSRRSEEHPLRVRDQLLAEKLEMVRKQVSVSRRMLGRQIGEGWEDGLESLDKREQKSLEFKGSQL